MPPLRATNSQDDDRCRAEAEALRDQTIDARMSVMNVARMPRRRSRGRMLVLSCENIRSTHQQ